MYFRGGTAVPAIEPEANTNGWYSISADEMECLLNP